MAKRRPYRHRHAEGDALVPHPRLGDGGAHACGEFFDLAGRRRTRHDDKFIAAIPRHPVTVAHDVLEGARDALQHLVAKAMPVFVVDLLEVVDV